MKKKVTINHQSDLLPKFIDDHEVLVGKSFKHEVI